MCLLRLFGGNKFMDITFRKIFMVKEKNTSEFVQILYTSLAMKTV